MLIQPIASGSKGNCYKIDDGHTTLLLEAGIPFKQIQEALNFETSRLAAALITHGHQDHCKGVKTLLERGINVYTSQGTVEEMGITHRRLKAFERKDDEFFKQVKIGSWLVLPFRALHDTAEPVNFLLQSDYGPKILFVTDSYYIKYRFSGISHFMVECNYNAETLNESVANGLHPAQKKRVMRSHMSLETLLTFFNETDLSKCEKIYLLHLSSQNANRHTIFTEVAKVTGKEIKIVG